jgi:hypothetical protein
MTVYKSDHKPVYHKPDCHHVTDAMSTVSERQAERLWWRKCQTCHDIAEPRDTPHCPRCRRASITPCPGGLASTKNTDHQWRCENCAHEFDDPAMVQGRGTVRGDTVAGKLERMDPDDLVAPSEADE